MNKLNQNSLLNAFTIFEVTVVMAIMGVLISIISLSLNRFNEQLKTGNDIGIEMNHFRAIRSTMWREFYTSDSISMIDNELNLYIKSSTIKYKVEGDLLHRKTNADWQIMNLEV